ncbi:putative gustatory receptor 2a [Leptinotarsa decemlineata]|uniref:putative gustatory receptor 2a n=1 Tax=Leptinotarsa decemlineata TaxID=7539 RepID=UPI003D308D21
MMALVTRTISGYLVPPSQIFQKFDIFELHFSSTIESLELGLFETYLLLVKSRIKIVNQELNSLTQDKHINRRRRINCSNDITKKLKKLRKVHWKLCSICVKLNRVFAFPLLVLIGITFLEFMSSAYFFMVNSQKIIMGVYDLKFSISAFFTPLTKIGSLIILCLVCTVIRNEVFKSADIIFDVKNKYQPEISREVCIVQQCIERNSQFFLNNSIFNINFQIQRFCRQILQWNLNFTAFDFFNIDMTLLYEVVTTATTYLTIMIQFRKN